MGQKYGKWEVERKLSEGGQNWVYLVNDTSGALEGYYVLKRIKNKKKIQRFETEVKARASLDHSCIPKIVDQDLEANKPYMVEEYIGGGDLFGNELFVDLSIDDVLKYFIQLCEVIKYSHEQGVIHRDIKPKNVLYEPGEDKLYITDFGICFLEGDDEDERVTLFEEQVGPRDFIAPELARGRLAKIEPRSDIYSLGKLLYYIYTGKIVHREEHRTDVYDLVKLKDDHRYELIHRLLDNMLQINPDQRFYSVHELLKQLKETLNLLNSDVNVIGDSIPQLCSYCGIGYYKRFAEYDPSKRDKFDASDKYYLEVRGKFESLGFKLPVSLTYAWHIFLCEHCGHVQSFMRKHDNRAWEDPSYRPPRPPRISY